MLSDLAPCFAKVYTVTPNCPRALSAEDLQKEARFHMDAEAAESVPDALHLSLIHILGKAGENHTGNPEADDVVAGDEGVGGVEVVRCV